MSKVSNKLLRDRHDINDFIMDTPKELLQLARQLLYVVAQYYRRSIKMINATPARVLVVDPGSMHTSRELPPAPSLQLVNYCNNMFFMESFSGIFHGLFLVKHRPTKERSKERPNHSSHVETMMQRYQSRQTICRFCATLPFHSPIPSPHFSGVTYARTKSIIFSVSVSN